MKQFTLPKKLTTRIYILTAVALLAIALIFSFMPLVNLDLISPESRASINDFLDQLNGKTGGDLQITEEDSKLGVTMPKIVGSIRLVIKVVNVVTSAEPDTPEKQKAQQESIDELEELLTSEDGRNTMKFVAALGATVKASMEANAPAGKSAGFGTIVLMLLSVFALLYVIIFIVIMPISMIIGVIAGAIRILKYRDNLDKPAKSISEGLLSLVVFPLILILCESAIPTLSIGSGAIVLFVVGILVALLSLFITRTRPYANEDFKYLNIMQGASLVGIVGAIVFFFSIVKTGTLYGFLNAWTDYFMEKVALYSDMKGVNSMYLLDAFLIILYATAVFATITYILNVVKRLTCTVKLKKNQTVSGSKLAVPILTLIGAYIIPTFLSSSNHAYTYTVDPKDTSAAVPCEDPGKIWEMSSDASSALTIALVGIILMIAAEVALIVLKKVYCKDLTEDDETQILTGAALTPEEKIAKAQATIANLSASIPATESAPKAEEAPAQQDPIEALKRYKELLDQGIITEEEFNEKKKELLNK